MKEKFKQLVERVKRIERILVQILERIDVLTENQNTEDGVDGIMADPSEEVKRAV